MDLYGWRLASLIGAALIGGYVVATALSYFLASVLPVPRSEATLIAHLLGFVIYAAAIIWVFSFRKPAKGWLYLTLASALLVAVGLAVRSS